MDTGAIRVADLAGSFDLQATVESGQTYRWHRADGGTYESLGAYGGDAWYHTVLPATAAPTNQPEVLRARQRDGCLEWEASFDAEAALTRLLGLGDDLPAIASATPADPLLERAYESYRGLRIVRDPAFASLISFICSAQMRVERIHAMQRRLEQALGAELTFDGETYHAFPTPAALAGAGESRLRELGLGYRAPYVVDSADLVAEEVLHPHDVIGLDYEEARETLTQFVGVGEKVADCVLLFSLEYLQAVPLDTWIRTAIADHYPECDRESYSETSRAIRSRFGGPFAGYVQTYVFHWLRSGGRVEAHG